MPMPLYDLLPGMKVNAEKTDAVMKKIQDILHRNVHIPLFPIPPCNSLYKIIENVPCLSPISFHKYKMGF